MGIIKPEYKKEEVVSGMIHWKVAAVINLVGLLIGLVPLFLSEGSYFFQLPYWPVASWLLGYGMIALGAKYISGRTVRDCLNFAAAYFVTGLAAGFLSILAMYTFTATSPIFGLMIFDSAFVTFLNGAIVYTAVNFFDFVKMKKSLKVALPALLAAILFSVVGENLLMGAESLSQMINLESFSPIVVLQAFVASLLSVFTFAHVWDEISFLESGKFAGLAITGSGAVIWISGLVSAVLIDAVEFGRMAFMSRLAVFDVFSLSLVLSGLVLLFKDREILGFLTRGYSGQS